MLVAFGIVTALTGGLHAFIWARLIRDTGLPPEWQRGLGIALWTLAALLPVGLLVTMRAPRAVAAPFSWIAFTWMGFMFLLFVSLLPAEAVRLLTRLPSLLSGTPPDPERRALLGRLLGGLVVSVALTSGLVAIVNALQRVREKRLTVKLKKLPAELSGYRIVQLTDVHVGPTIGLGFVRTLVDKVNALQPDLVVITGDLVDGSVTSLEKHVAPLAELRSKDGVFFVTGNHEYYSGPDEWIAHLQSLGIRVLRNERVTVASNRGGGFDLAGVDDARARDYGRGHGMDVARALSGREESRPCVLLAHQPKAIFDAAKFGACLQLSGHTHAGQIFPFTYLVKLDQPYVTGLHQHGETQIYVSEGTGYWGPPMRLGTWAEITHIELVA